MGLYSLHPATGSEKFAVKYALEPCFGLRALRRDIWAQFADATVFEERKQPFVQGVPPELKQIRTLKQDVALNRQKHNQPLRVAVKNRIDDI
jgi:hypothetical protein